MGFKVFSSLNQILGFCGSSRNSQLSDILKSWAWNLSASLLKIWGFWLHCPTMGRVVEAPGVGKALAI